jgi:hypothetical protein
MFGIVVAVAVQNAFHLKIHYFLKIIFYISTSKQSENIKKNYFKQKKIQNLKERGPNTPAIGSAQSHAN